jgi:hypothetical protein
MKDKPDTTDFENEVLIPKFNQYCQSRNLPFMITSIDSIEILSLLHQRYDAISGFFKSIGKYYAFKGQLYRVDFFAEVAGMEQFSVTQMTPENVVSDLNRQEGRIRFLERALRKKEIWLVALTLTVIILILVWRFSVPP